MDELAQQASKWNLNSDRQLLEWMKSFSEKIEKKCAETTSRLNSLLATTDTMDAEIRNCHLIFMTKLQETGGRQKYNITTANEHPPPFTSSKKVDVNESYRSAIQRALEEVKIGPPRPLPHIIGSLEFSQTTACGLADAAPHSYQTGIDPEITNLASSSQWEASVSEPDTEPQTHDDPDSPWSSDSGERQLAMPAVSNTKSNQLGVDRSQPSVSAAQNLRSMLEAALRGEDDVSLGLGALNEAEVFMAEEAKFEDDYFFINCPEPGPRAGAKPEPIIERQEGSRKVAGPILGERAEMSSASSQQSQGWSTVAVEGLPTEEMAPGGGGDVGEGGVKDRADFKRDLVSLFGRVKSGAVDPGLQRSIRSQPELADASEESDDEDLTMAMSQPKSTAESPPRDQRIDHFHDGLEKSTADKDAGGQWKSIVSKDGDGQGKSIVAKGGDGQGNSNVTDDGVGQGGVSHSLAGQLKSLMSQQRTVTSWSSSESDRSEKSSKESLVKGEDSVALESEWSTGVKAGDVNGPESSSEAAVTPEQVLVESQGKSSALSEAKKRLDSLFDDDDEDDEEEALFRPVSRSQARSK